MEWIHAYEEQLRTIVTVVKLLLESISALSITLGLVITLSLVIARVSGRGRSLSFLEVRSRFGMWLALALEFQLGADILATTIAPSFEALGQLGAIAVIRTFLNYFLQKELEAEQRMELDRQRLESPPTG